MHTTATIEPLGQRRCITGSPCRVPRPRLLRLGFALAVWVLPAALPAATFTVNSTVDQVDVAPGNSVCETGPGNGICTLRAAIQEANALAGADTVDLPAGTYTMQIGGGDDFAVMGDFDIREELTLNGAGSGTTFVDANTLDRAFDIQAGVDASLSALTVRNGLLAAGEGGGIRVLGSLTLADATLTANNAKKGGGLWLGASASLVMARVTVTANGPSDSGGGIFAKDSSSLSFTDVTVTGNSSTNEGGGYYSEAVVTGSLDGVTIDNNSSDKGAGLFFKGAGATTLTNVTLSGNTASTNGGGIRLDSVALTLTNVTISGNTALSVGSNIQVMGGSITLTNTIIANSGAGDNCSGTITDNGNNLADDTSCGTIPDTLSGLDPTLADNGGPTETNALLPGSSALDQGDNGACPATDQRGYARPGNAICDIGAYEESLSDVVIDGDFSEWDNDLGNEHCVADEGGADDWNSPDRLDITKFCLATNTEDELYALFAFDEVSLSGNNEATACLLADTPPNDGNADFFFCVTIEGGPTTVKEIGAYTCPNDQPYDCYPRGDPLPGFTPVYGFSNTEPGPWDTDTLIELLIPWSDIGISEGDVVFTAMISYPGQSAANGDLNNPKDSIFGGINGGVPYQDYDKKIKLNIHTGKVTTTPITLAWLRVEDRGSGVLVEWMTATETANVGFNLYAVGDEGLRLLNDELIPSAVIDSLEPQRYSFEARRAREESFVLEDVDLFGVRRYHGPFVRGEARGAEPKPERIAWRRIRDERAARKAAWRGDARGNGRGGRRGGALGGGSSSGLPEWRRIGPQRRGWAEARLEVSEDGIYRVSYEQLLAAGVDLTGAPLRSLSLTVGGEPVPIRVEEPGGFMVPDHGLRSGRGFMPQSHGGGSSRVPLQPRPGGRSGGRFGPGAFIEFVGQAQDTLYTRTNVYTLQVDPQRALRVQRDRQTATPWASVPASYREHLEVDRDHKYILTAPGEDPWYEAHLLAYGGPASREFKVEVDGYAGGRAALEVELWGLSAFPSDPDHHVELEWNSSWLGEERFDGRTVHRVTADLWHGQLAEGENRLALTLPGDTGTPWDMVAFDRLWLSYARRFEPRQGRLRFEGMAEAFEIVGVSGSEAVAYRMSRDVPVLLEGLSWLADADGSSRVRIPGTRGPRPGRRGGGGAETVYYFAETASLLVAGIVPLEAPAELFGSAELLVISHEEFLDGIQPLVNARRSEGWSVAVVDVEDVYTRESDGVVDPRALRDFIRFAATEHQTEAVLLVGGDTYDYHDNLGVGSISFIPSLYVATDEVVRYAPVDPLYGDVDGDGVPDVSVGRLPVRTPEELDSLVARILEYGEIGFSGSALLAADGYDVPAGYSFTAASDEMAAGLLGGWELTRAYIDELGTAGARKRLIEGINGGVALTSYFGHSGPTAWSFDNLFSTADATALENSGRPTVVTQWGCWNNYHVTPSYNTLGHKLLLSDDRGAAAVLGATTLTQATAERKLGSLLFARLGRPGVTLGQALVGAKQALAQTDPGLVDVILGWTLLGDPTLRIERATGDRDRRRAGRGS